MFAWFRVVQTVDGDSLCCSPGVPVKATQNEVPSVQSVKLEPSRLSSETQGCQDNPSPGRPRTRETAIAHLTLVLHKVSRDAEMKIWGLGISGLHAFETLRELWVDASWVLMRQRWR